MVIIYKDSSAYIPLQGEQYGFYSSKFEFLLNKENISYRIIDYRHPPFGVSDNFEDYDDWKGDYFVARFGHELSDKEYHSKNYDVIYDYYGENMWPNKQTYYYYDDKVRQYELLEKYGIQVPSVTCNNLDELLKNVTVGTVIKSTYGAGSESTFYVWKKEHLDNIEEYISNCYNSENFFPCQIQEYINTEYEKKIVITNDEIYGIKQKLDIGWDNPNDFPFNYGDKHWANRRGNSVESLDESEFGLLDTIIDIKTELNIPNLKFDIIDKKVIEFTYMYGELLPETFRYMYFDMNTKSFEEKVVSVNDFAYKQPNSVLKHLGVIE